MPELRSAKLSQALKAMAEPLLGQRVGVDAIHLPSWGRYLEVGGESFLRRNYSEAELEHCEGKAERLAARFAGKEAVLKVLGSGIEGVGLGAVEITSEASGRPVVCLHEPAVGLAKTLGLSEFELSLCHEEDYALAVASAQLEVDR